MTAAETGAPGTSGEGHGAGPGLNPPGDLEPRQDIPLRGSQTAGPEVVRETSQVRATPGNPREDLAQDHKQSSEDRRPFEVNLFFTMHLLVNHCNYFEINIIFFSFL